MLMILSKISRNIFLIYLSYCSNYFGKLITVELIKNGDKILVNEENKNDYVDKVSKAKLINSILP